MEAGNKNILGLWTLNRCYPNGFILRILWTEKCSVLITSAAIYFHTQHTHMQTQTRAPSLPYVVWFKCGSTPNVVPFLLPSPIQRLHHGYAGSDDVPSRGTGQPTRPQGPPPQESCKGLPACDVHVVGT